jgi:hypothetical protein
MNNYAEGTQPVPARGNPYAKAEQLTKEQKEQERWKKFVTARDFFGEKPTAAGKPKA